MSIPSIDLVVETTRVIVVEIDGDQTVTATDEPTIELDLTMPGIQGPAGPQGETGPQGPPGPAGAAREEHYAFAVPSTVWLANHTIVITPNVYTYDLNDVIVEGDVSFPTPTSVRVEWAWPMAGRLVVTT